MPQCPNCGQATSRTEDWACQWCGYPLLSSSYKKIPETYRQLKGKELQKQEAAAPPASDDIPLPEALPEPEPEPEPEPKPEPKPEPPPVAIEVVQKQEAPVAEEAAAPPASDDIPLPKAPPEPEPKPKPEPEPESKPEPKPESKPEPKPESKPEPKPEPEPEPKPEPLPVAMEVTVDDLLSAYREQGEAADGRFADKILSLTGVVTRVEINDNLDVYYIILSSLEKKHWQSIRCVFEKKYQAELSRLAKEQTATVRGRYNGSIIDIRMRDCVLVQP